MCQNIFTTNNEDQEGQYKQTYECNNNFLSKMKIVTCILNGARLCRYLLKIRVSYPKRRLPNICPMK